MFRLFVFKAFLAGGSSTTWRRFLCLVLQQFVGFSFHLTNDIQSRIETDVALLIVIGVFVTEKYSLFSWWDFSLAFWSSK